MQSHVSRAGAAAIVVFAFLFSVTTVHAQTAKSKPGTVFRDCANCPEMVVIPAGSFMMGSPDSEVGRKPDQGPQHKVTIPRRFAVAKFELTRGEYGEFIRQSGYDPGSACAVLGGPPRDPKKVSSDDFHSNGVEGYNWANPNFPQTDRHPVVCVTWKDTKAYIAWLSQKTGKTYRLLSEAEWEYVARAGYSTIYTFGSNLDDACRYGNGADLVAKEQTPIARNPVNCRDGYGIGTAPVGSFQANAFGVFDVYGNVFERVEDCYNESYTGAPSDGSAWLAGECKFHVARGGAWVNNPGEAILSAAARVHPLDTFRTAATGIRLARTLE